MRGEAAVKAITWTGGRIAPGEFQEFELSGGPMPGAESIAFVAEQTYDDDDEVVVWGDLPADDGTEVKHPAPMLTLVDPVDGDGGHGSPATTEPELDTPAGDDRTDPAALAGFALGLIAVVLASIALIRGRSTS